MTVDKFLEKREQAQLEEAKELAINYKNKFKKNPPIEIFHEYFMLFTKNIEENEIFNKKANLCGNRKDTIKFIEKNKPLFDNYEEFLKYCLEN